jgi:hypothetical protein
MNTKADWDAAAAELMAAERERLGGPPSPEEVAAFVSGELSEAEAERIRALLAYYPELTSILTEPAPPPARGVLTPEELAHDRAALLARMPVPLAPRRRTPTWLAVAASALFLIAVGLGVQVQRLSSALHEPRVMSRHVLKPSPLERGPGRKVITELPAGESYRLAPDLDGFPGYERFRIDFMGRRFDVRRGEEISVLRLEPGDYQFDLYGIDREGPQFLATYVIRVSEAAGSDRPRG